MTPLVLSAACRLLHSAPLVPIFSVLISVSRTDGSFVTGLAENAFDFAYFPSGEDQNFGVGLQGLVTRTFNDYSKIPAQVAPGCYGFALAFPDTVRPYVPLLFVTVTEFSFLVVPVPSLGLRPEREVVAQGQIVIGKVEDADS